MTREEFIENYSLEDETVILEDWDTFKSGIIGITEDHKHIVYSYEKLAEGLALAYQKDYKEGKYPVKLEEGLSEDEMFQEFYQDAIDWIEVNTLGGIEYCDSEYKPIIIFETDEI